MADTWWFGNLQWHAGVEYTKEQTEYVKALHFPEPYLKKLAQYGHTDMWLVMDRKLSDNNFTGKASPTIVSIPLASSVFNILKAIEDMVAKKSPNKAPHKLRGIRQLGDFPIFEVSFFYPVTKQQSVAKAQSTTKTPSATKAASKSKSATKK